MTWHYLPVSAEENGETVYSLCEVFLDEAGRLAQWGEPYRSPLGNDISDLMGELEHMLKDAQRWAPVRYEDLRVGAMLKDLESEPAQ